MKPDWKALNTAGKIEAVMAVYQPDFSAAQIASMFEGATRGAIIGLFHRHANRLGGRTLKPKPGGPKPKARPAPPKRKHATPKAPKRAVRGGKVNRARLRVVTPAIEQAVFGAPQTAGLPLMKLTSRCCRWPVGALAGEHQLFCGEVTNEGRSYCGFHMAQSVGQGTESERTAISTAKHMAREAA